MLVTLVLLAILTIGAASASDDAASDDLAVSDGDSVVAGPENDGGYDINPIIDPDDGGDESSEGGDEPSEEIWINDWGDIAQQEDSVVSVKAKNDTDYTLDIVLKAENYEELDTELSIIELNSSFENKVAWEENDSFTIYDIRLKDVNFAGVNDGDILVFKLYDDDVFIASNEAIYHNNEGTITFEGYPEIWVSENDIVLDDDVVVEIKVYNGTEATLVISSDTETIFEVKLDEIVNKVAWENDRYTIYKITHGNLTLDNINDGDSINFELIDNYENVIADGKYIIHIDSEDIISFERDDSYEGDGEPSGEGVMLDGVEFRSANAQNNDVVVVIPIADFPQDIANEFTVAVINEDGNIYTAVNLTKFENDDSSYYIRVSDLGIEELEIGEGIGVDLIVQFYDKNGDPIYYAQTFDDESIYIFNSPFIFDEASIFSDDDVITFQEIPDGVDEFNVTIQKEGVDAVVKTFKFSELENQYEEGEIWYALKLKDLGITETGDYEITVKFSEELKYTGNLNVNRRMEIFIHNLKNEDNPGPELREFTSIDEVVANLRISENIKGSVNLTIGENDPIVFDFADLKYDPDHPPSDGRRILLNDLKIQKSGTYKINMTIYDEDGGLIDGTEFDLFVTVGENTVEFNDAYYTAEIYDTIKFTISTPLSSEQYYNIYFNDELAGKYSTDGIVIINDKFYDIIWGDGEDDDVKFLKYGDYDVNITFFDGESESSTQFAGKFSIKSLNMTADKDVYSEDDEITISFDAQDPGEYYPVVYVQNALGWGYMDPFFDEDWEITFIGEGVTELIKDGKFTANIGKLPAGTNYIYVDYFLYESGDAYMYDNDAVFAFHDLMPIKVISPVDPGLTIAPISDVEEGRDVLVEVNANETFSGPVSVLVGGKVVATVDVVGGYGNVTVLSGNFTVGSNTVNVTSVAGDKFAAGEATATFNVTKKVVPPTPSELVDSALTISIADITEGENAVIKITTNITFSGDVLVKMGTSNYTVSVVNGTGSAPVTGLTVGTYNATATFKQTEVFNASEKNTTFTVKPKVATAITASTVTTTYATSKHCGYLKGC